MTLAHPRSPHGGATLSSCGQHRFLLSRRIDTEGPSRASVVGWIMFNPSTADAEADDPTIRKCLGFSQRVSAGEIVVANLFSWRATNPKEVRAHLDDACPGENLDAIDYVLRESDVVVCAWGRLAAPAWAQERVRSVLRRAEAEPYALTKLHVIDLSKDGHPVHPLMQGYAKGLRAWRPEVPR